MCVSRKPWNFKTQPDGSATLNDADGNQIALFGQASNAEHVIENLRSLKQMEAVIDIIEKDLEQLRAVIEP